MRRIASRCDSQATPARRASISRRITLALLCGMAITVTGCLKEILLLGYLIGGPPSLTPAFSEATGNDMTDKDIKVAVVCIAKRDIRRAHGEVGLNLMKLLTYQMQQNKIVMIPPGRVIAWLDRNRDDFDSPLELGEEVGADYVVMIDLYKFSLWDKGSAQLMRGRAEAGVSVYDLNDDDDRPIFTKSVNEAYPTTIARPASQTPPATFKKEFLDRMARVIGRLFFPHYHGDDMPDAT